MAPITFGGNDYLDLARHPKVLEASIEALSREGLSSCASRVSVGTTSDHVELETQLAEFLEVEEVVVLSSGYLAVLAAFDAIDLAEVESPTGYLHSDAHPSLLKGVKARGLQADPFTSNTIPKSQQNTAFFASDACDGFNGVVRPIQEFTFSSPLSATPLIVDDCHGIGVFGPKGRGTLAHFGFGDEKIIQIGSFGKAFGSAGGFVAGSHNKISQIRSGPNYQGSTALSPVLASGALAALRILEEEPERAEQLIQKGIKLESTLIEEGLPVISPEANECSFPAVITLSLPNPEIAQALASDLQSREIDIAHFTYASSASSSKLRIPLSSRHTEDDLERLLEGLVACYSPTY